MTNNNWSKKIMVIIVTLFMLVGNVPCNVIAEDYTSDQETIETVETTENKTTETEEIVEEELKEELPETIELDTTTEVVEDLIIETNDEDPVIEEETVVEVLEEEKEEEIEVQELEEETEEVEISEEEELVEETETLDEEEILEEEIIEEEISEEEEIEEIEEELVSFEASETIDGITITVNAEEGAFPKGSTLSVRKVNSYEERKVEEAIEEHRDNNTNVVSSYTFDIKVLDKDSNEIQPQEGKKVEVSFKLEEIANENLDTNIYHIQEDTLDVETLDTQVEDDTVVVETEGFSYYTVQFTYNSLTYTLDGNGEVALSEILTAVGLEGTATAAVSSDSEVIEVVEEEGNFTIKSKKFFTGNKTLTVTIDGTDYEITVTGPTDFNQIDNSDIWWKFDSETGTLTVTGSGPLPDFGYTTKPASWKSPWNSIRSQVQKIEFAEDSNITSIGQNAFIGFRYITSIEIPKTVTSIGQYAFYRVAAYKCVDLKSVIFEEGSVCKSIGNYAFDALANLEHIDLPDGLETIGKEAFNGTTSLQEEIVFPKTIQSIGEKAFNNSGITGVSFSSESDPILDIYVFSGCTNLETVDMGGTTSIKAYDFYRCTALKTFIGEEVRTMGYCSLSKNSSTAPRLSLLRLPKLESLTGDWAFNSTYADAAAIGPKILENSAHSEFSGSMLANLITNLNVNSDYTVELKPFIESKGTYTGQLFEATLKDPQGNIVTSDEWYYSWPNGSTYKYPDLSIYPDDRYEIAGRSYIEGWKYGISSSAVEVKCFAWRFGNDGMIEITEAASYPVEKASDHPLEALHQNFDDLSVIMFKGETSIAVKSLLGRASVPGMDSSLVEMISPGEWEKDPEKPEGETIYYVKITNPESSDSSIVSAASSEDVGKECKFIANKVGSTSIDFRMITAAINIISDESPIYGRAATRSVAKVEEAQASNPGPSVPFELRVHVIDAKTQDITQTSITLVLEGVNEEIGSIACTLGGQTLVATPDNMTLTFTGLKPDTEYSISLKTADNATGIITNGFKDINTRTLPKEDQEKPEAPTAKTIGTNSIELNPIENGLYRLGEDGEWQTSPLFEGLEMDTEYVFYQKIAEDDVHNESPVSDSATIRTSKHIHEWTYAAEGVTITATCENSDGLHEGELTSTITVVAPALTVYGESKSAEATLEGGIDGVDNPTIIYKNGDDELTEAPTNAGTYTANITLENATASVEYTIAKAEAPILAENQKPSAADLVYAGSDQSLLIEAQEELPENYTMMYAISESAETTPSEDDFNETIPTGKDAGSYYVWYYAKGDDNHESCEPVCIEVHIAKKPINVVADSKSKTYGKDDPELTYTADDLFEGDSFTGALKKHIDEGQTGEDVGTYTIIQNTLSAGDNYAINYTPATLTITKATDNDITVNISGWTYGDEPNDPTATVDFGTAAFKYSNQIDGEYHTTKPTDAGTYYVKAIVEETDNYVGATSEAAEFVIAKKEVSLTWGSTDLTYNGKTQHPEVNVNGLIGDDTCEVIVEGGQKYSNAKTETENYTATATGLKNPNYELIQEETKEFTIAQKEIVVDGIESRGKVYDGSEDATASLYYEDEHLVGKIDDDDLSLEATGTFEDANVGLDKKITINSLKLVGNDAGNYKLAEEGQQTECKGNIGTLTVNVKAENKTKVYGASDPEFTYTYEPKLVEGDEFEGELSRQAGENVGEHIITLNTLHDHEGNYAINYTHGILTITKAMSNTATVVIQGWTYGDTPKTPTATATFGLDDVKFVYSNSLDGEYSESVPENAGTYYVKAVVEETDNYVGATSEAREFVIAKKEVGLTWSEQTSFEYNGNAHKPTATATGLVGDDKCKVTVEGEETYSNAKTRTDKYTATATGLDNPNYKLPAEVSKDFTITPAKIIVSGIGAKNKTYDKTVNAELDLSKVTLFGKIDNDNVGISAIGEFEDYNFGMDKTVNIKNLTLTGEDKDNYVLSAEGQELTATAHINKKQVSVKAVSNSKTYGEIDPELTYTASELIDGDSYTGVLFRDRGENVGVYDIKQGSVSAGNNYSISFTSALFTINKADITITAVDKTSIYGDDLEALTYEVSEGDLVEGDELKIALTTSASNTASVGQYDIVPSWEVEDKNYNATFVNGTYDITLREVGLTWRDVELTYDGMAQMPTAIATNLVNNDTCEVIVEGEQIHSNVKSGTDYYVATATSLSNTNYKLPDEVTTNFTIAQAEITVSDIEAKDKVYDGNKTAQLDYSNVKLKGLIGKEIVSVEATGTFEDKNAGEDKTVNITGLTLTGDDKDNYVLASEGQQEDTTADIYKISIIVDAEAKEKVYGNPDPELTYEYTGELVGDDDFSGSLEREEGEDVGTFEIKQGTLSLSDNYVILYNSAKLIITQAPNNVTASIEGWTYGNSANEPIAEADFGQDTATFTYSDKEDGDYTTEVPTQAGTYYVKATIAETDNYEGAESEPVEFEIAKKEVELEWGSNEFTYNGKAQKPTATAKGLIEGDECEVTVEGEQKDSNIKTDTEKYTATATSLSNNNYKLPADTRKDFTIAQKQISKDMLSMDSDSLKNDGTNKGPNITIKDDELVLGDDDYKLSGQLKSTNNGTHFITVEATGNYLGSFEVSWNMYGDKQNNQVEKGKDGKGDLEIFVDIEGNTENITVENFTIDFAKNLLTEEDLQRYNEGERVLIYIELFETDKEDVEVLDENLISEAFKELGATNIRWFNILIWKKIGNEAAQLVHETNEDVVMDIEIPQEYKNAPANCDRLFYLLRSHDNEVSILNSTINTQITLSSNKFSFYAIGYKDIENRKDERRIPKTGD